jgi:hypothetical protein
MENLIQNKYFKSKDVKVFPSSFRGAYKSGRGTAPEISFDPEARLNTEANFILSRTTLGNDSYIIDYDTTQNKITFVLGGYYFEIAQISDYINEIKNKPIGIILRDITLQDPGDLDLEYRRDSTRTTKLLASWESASANILDIVEDEDDSTKYYYFTGLKVFESDFATEGSSAVIKLFTSTGQLNQTACQPTILHGSGENTLMHGVGLEAAHANQVVVGKYNKNTAGSLFEVGNGTSAATADRKNALEISTDKTTINTNTQITGTTTITGSLSVSNKITSAATVAGDNPNTLITKSYVDNMVGGIGSGSTGGGDGQYVQSVSQSGAAVSTVLKSFDSTVTNNDTNAPTSKAVKNFVKTVIEGDGTADNPGLNVNTVGGSNTYIQKISEENGLIKAIPNSFSTSISAASDDTTAPTAKAVYDYIEAIKNNLDSDLSEKIGTAKNEAISNTATELGKLMANTTTGTVGTGKYLQGISQENGKVATTELAFESYLSPTNNTNAPTSKAVGDYVADAIAKLWYTPSTKQSASTGLKALKTLILDATYPVGSIYTMYSEASVDTCPIASALGGTWTQIPTGRFLVSGTGDRNNTYTVATMDGDANAVVVAHEHTFDNVTVTTSENGSHNHTHKQRATAHDTSNDNCFRSANSSQGGSIEVTITTGTAGAHTHTVNLYGIQTMSTGEDGTNKNLPPYLAVYMWRRIS